MRKMVKPKKLTPRPLPRTVWVGEQDGELRQAEGKSHQGRRGQERVLNGLSARAPQES